MRVFENVVWSILLLAGALSATGLITIFSIIVIIGT